MGTVLFYSSSPIIWASSLHSVTIMSALEQELAALVQRRSEVIRLLAALYEVDVWTVYNLKCSKANWVQSTGQKAFKVLECRAYWYEQLECSSSHV